MWLNLLNTLTWWQWSLLALVPPAIVALYFLKLKREPLEVPSTYLWRKSIEDMHVNSIWQRLRQNLLLFLQLLLVLLAILALLRPGTRAATLSGDRFIFLVDQSASMSATDVEPSRLAEAKRRVLELIEQMGSGSKAMIISFSDTAQVVQEYTDNRRLLRERLESIRPTGRTTSLLGALQLAAGLANPGRTATEAGDVQVADPLPATMYILSDGKFADAETENFSLGNLTPIFIAIGLPEAPNVAITAFNSQPNESAPEKTQAFARLENKKDDEVSVPVELTMNDRLVDADEIHIKARDSQSVVFDLGEVESGQLRLEINSPDALDVDNTAYCAVDPPRKGRVLLVTPGNDALRGALVTRRATQVAEVELASPQILNTDQYRQSADSGLYDLIIYDQCQPKSMPQANTLFVGRLPPSEEWRRGARGEGRRAKGEGRGGGGEGDESPGGESREGGEAESGVGVEEPRMVVDPQIIDTDQAHPLMQYVEMSDILIGESIALDPPSGSSLLIDSNRGKLCAIAPRGSFEDLVLGFEIMHTAQGNQKFNTTWPSGSLSFPTFFLNVLSYLGGSQHAQSMISVRPGQPVQLKSSSPTEQLEIVAPDGHSESVPRGRHGTFPFHGTDQVGMYQVKEGKKVTRRFAVNLFHSAESDIQARPGGKLQIGHVDEIGHAGWEPARREMWKLLLVAALLVLLFEWYVYNRRVYI